MIHEEHEEHAGYENLHPLVPPNPTWQAHAAGHAARCAALLWGEEGGRAREYLHRRGLGDGVLRAFQAGYNPQDVWEDFAQWGLPEPDDGEGEGGDNRGRHPPPRLGSGRRGRIWIPRGITFPWCVAGEDGGPGVWRLNVLRPLTAGQIAGGEALYGGPAGFANALYNAAALRARGSTAKPVVLLAEEIDALAVAQACPTEVIAVATGSAAGGRRLPWVTRLARAPVVLVAPGGGEKAADWWLHALPNGCRLGPLGHEAGAPPDPEEVRAWIAGALRREGGASADV